MRRFLLALTLPVLAHAQDLRTQEKIVVERILVDTRVTDYAGEPILGLTAEDFEVRVGGKRAVVESVLWIPETTAARIAAGVEEDEPRPQTIGDVPAPQGRLFIYFFQTDFARNASRTTGQMKFLHFVDQLIENLEEGDRVAVFSFDSHLKFRLDFTDEKRDIRHAVEQALLTDQPPPPPIVPSPSLARRLDREEMKRCTSSDVAFVLIANALRPIPGPKSMILVGWGLGHRVGRMVTMDAKYPIARYALDTARVTVFALDITEADYHDLEFGLGKAAEDTGGFYAKMYTFPRIAIDRLERTLAGHYELEVRKPEGLRLGTHSIEVRVKRRGAVVMARSTFVDRPD